MRIRTGEPDEVTGVMGILEAAMLDVSAGTVRSLAGGGEEGTILLAVEGGRTLGALVLDGREIEAVAVRPRRRDQGIGSALVRAASEGVDGPLFASFDADLRPFYEGLGFQIEPGSCDEPTEEAGSADDDRLRGRLSDEPR